MNRGLVFSFVSLAVAAATPPAPAVAQPVVREETVHYAINGRTGMELYQDMVRRGPRHGFLSKAIAQTKYKVTPRGDWRHRDGTCGLVNAGYTLELTYTYPRPSSKLPAELERRWKTFIAETTVHEKTHGRLALKMARELDRRLRTFSMKDHRGCWRARSTLERELAAIFQAYEKKQIAFDNKEHREGGAVQKTALKLIGKN